MDDALRFSEATELLYQGRKLDGCTLTPESPPIFMTTAFVLGDLDDVHRTYDEKGYTYVRTRNPNRTALGDAISYLEQGKFTLLFNSGMGAITTTFLTLLRPGDHMLANAHIYGETLDVINQLLIEYGVSVDLVDFEDLEAVRAAMKPETKMVYAEVVSNPTDHLADIEALAGIAHDGGALLMVDNTFTTPIAVKPMTLGADIVINSLTKFMNGHSDTLAGSITLHDEELYEQIHAIRMLTGTSGSPFGAWMIQRSLQTLDLRVRKQMANATKLAQALENHPRVLKVNHPSLPTHPQHQLAMKLFKNTDNMTAMFSFEMPDDKEKINAFMNRLHLAHYAPTLGGTRTTLSHPMHSSHHHVPPEELEKMGISYGLMRVSVGIEEGDDLVNDFIEAMSVF